ncbi:patched family domain-containing protein [Ditylenchus destructor]|nr:patched family domain-containing protein [Ditylenchus destructor]
MKTSHEFNSPHKSKSFGIGCLTPFPSVKIFCVYASVAVLFTYVYQLTFFISILYVTCAREVQHRNCVTMRKMKTSHEFNSPHKSKSFGIGCLTPFPSVKIFCVYASVAVLFTYVYQLTFFISILYVTCAREVQHRNCVTMRKMKTSHEFNSPHKSKADAFSMSWMSEYVPPPKYTASNNKNIFCENGYFPSGYNQNHMFARLFYTRYTTLLLDYRAQLWILTAFIIYLIIPMEKKVWNYQRNIFLTTDAIYTYGCAIFLQPILAIGGFG